MLALQLSSDYAFLERQYHGRHISIDERNIILAVLNRIKVKHFRLLIPTMDGVSYQLTNHAFLREQRKLLKRRDFRERSPAPTTPTPAPIATPSMPVSTLASSSTVTAEELSHELETESDLTASLDGALEDPVAPVAATASATAPRDMITRSKKRSYSATELEYMDSMERQLRRKV
ncbi:hypothetical protein BJ508DRAFT_180867 [Ascobolus immersus RN42]|uniref:Uncharacterized protein n=1 Tax=Ascobolus immersus RN42 TaxID=1160509 RepID=A0A3N4HW98_ASCIM|nr:hypothetical protein BJ508DRAFT_180867 [Ascobolus immersus RN42]